MLYLFSFKESENSFHGKSGQPLNLDDISLSSDDSQQSFERFLKKDDSTDKKIDDRIKYVYFLS